MIPMMKWSTGEKRPVHAVSSIVNLEGSLYISQSGQWLLAISRFQCIETCCGSELSELLENGVGNNS